MTTLLSPTSTRPRTVKRSTIATGLSLDAPVSGVTRQPASKVTVSQPRPDPAYKALDALQNGHLRSSPNFFTSLILAVVSLGTLPALLWQIRFRRQIETDCRALSEVAQWGRRRLDEADGLRLVEAAERVRFAPVLLTVGMLGVILALGAVAWGMTQITAQYDLFTWLLGLTYGAFWPRFSAVTAAGPISVFALWTVGLTIAYTAHLAQVHLHAVSVRRFLDEFNRLSIGEGFTPVLLEPIGFGLSPWVLTGFAVLMLSGGWAVPFAFAGGTDCRLRRRALPRMRKAIAGRVCDIIFAHVRPSESLTPSLTRCATGGCGRPLGKGVKFCPRCGTRVFRSVDRWI